MPKINPGQVAREIVILDKVLAAMAANVTAADWNDHVTQRRALAQDVITQALRANVRADPTMMPPPPVDLGAIQARVTATVRGHTHWTRCYCEECRSVLSDRATLLALVRALQETLARIERWHGEFPETGITWDDRAPMSFGACYGSNGERDFMRSLARAALTRIAGKGTKNG